MMEIKRPESRQQIPTDAKKMYTGVLYDVYQWQQKRFDGSVATFEKLRRNDSVVIVPVTEDGKILVAREQQPGTTWYETLPCGGIDSGEAPDVAAKRELLEETGYAPTELELWFAHQVESRVDWAIFVFIAKGCKKVAPQNAGAGESLETREISFDEFLKLCVADDFQNINVAPKLLKAALDPVEMSGLKKRLGVF